MLLHGIDVRLLVSSDAQTAIAAPEGEISRQLRLLEALIASSGGEKLQLIRSVLLGDA